MYFCTGDGERKAKNLESNPHCILTTGCNNLDCLDVVVEGKVEKVSDRTELQSAGDAYESKNGSHFTSPDGTWFGLGDLIRQSKVVLYRLAPGESWGSLRGNVQPDSVGVLLQPAVTSLASDGVDLATARQRSSPYSKTSPLATSVVRAKSCCPDR